MKLALVSLAVLAFASLALAAQPSPSTFALTRDGKPACTIVLAADPTRAASFAAEELAFHVRKMTGANLPIVTDEQRVTGPRILLGESSATRALGLTSASFKSQEYLVRISSNTMVLLGRDASPHSGKSSDQPFTWAEGKFGKGLSFNGKSDYFSVGDCGFSDEAGSMECWVWLPAASQDTESTLLRLDGSGPWTYHILRRWPGTSTLGYTVYDGTNGFNVSSQPLAEGWHHVLCTHDEAAGKMELFVDGVSQGTAKFTHTTCHGSPLFIGAVANSGTVGNALRAVMDEVRVSTVVRDPKTDAAGGPYSPDASTACLFHFDEGHGSPRDATGNVRVLNCPDLFEEKGSLTAVYDFLERFCGVRWYAPGDVGLVCPSKPTLTVVQAELRRAPAMRHRWITPTSLFMPTPKDAVSGVDLMLWKLRMRIGGEPFWACHSFGGFYDRFYKTHPDWFAQGYTGQPPQMCYTSPGFIDQVVQDANDYFDGKGMPPGGQGMGDYFSLVPMDTAGWCKAEPCPSLLDAAQAQNPQFSNGHASNYIWGFVNKVAAEVRKTHPDKWIAALAYWEYAYYPDKVKLEPNVTVQMCLHTRNWWCPSMEANDTKILHDWRAADPNRPLYLWLYYCFPALNASSGSYNAFPGFFAHTIVRQMKMYHDAHIQGIFLEHSSEMGLSYLMDQLEFYVTFKLADDPTLDGNKLIDEFFTLYYGSAAEPMKKLYLGIEDAYSNPRSYPVEIQKSPAHQHQNEALAWGSLGTQARMAQFGKLMDQARLAAKTDLEKQRVGLFEKGVWDYMVEGRRKYLERQKVQVVPPPSATVPRIADASGDPARADWSKALVCEKWTSLAGDATDRKFTTRLAHDGKFLYVELTDASLTGALVSSGDIWGGDDWEVFFAHQRARPYRQFCISPAGKTAAPCWGEELDNWAKGSASSSDTSSPTRWTVRMAFPLATLLAGGVKPGQKFYANFFRQTANPRELFAWSPTFIGGFQDTARLGELTLE